MRKIQHDHVINNDLIRIAQLSQALRLIDETQIIPEKLQATCRHSILHEMAHRIQMVDFVTKNEPGRRRPPSDQPLLNMHFG